MKIKMSEKELNNICNNVVKQVSRYIQLYMEQSELAENQQGVYMIEAADLIEDVLNINIDLNIINQPKGIKQQRNGIKRITERL